MSATSSIPDPLSPPFTQQRGESDADYMYRHAYRHAYLEAGAAPGRRHYIARDYAEWARRCILADPSTFATWIHSDAFAFWNDHIR